MNKSEYVNQLPEHVCKPWQAVGPGWSKVSMASKRELECIIQLLSKKKSVSRAVQAVDQRTDYDIYV